MHSNVGEWCQDKHEVYPAGPVTLTQPERPVGREKEDNAVRLVRGSGWGSFAGDCRSAYRYGREPGTRLSSSGVRVARSAPPVK